MHTITHSLTDTTPPILPEVTEDLNEVQRPGTVTEAVEEEFQRVSFLLSEVLQAVQSGTFLTASDRQDIADVHRSAKRLLGRFSAARFELSRVRYYDVPKKEITKLTGDL